jgi:hypothetical protein
MADMAQCMPVGLCCLTANLLLIMGRWKRYSATIATCAHDADNDDDQFSNSSFLSWVVFDMMLRRPTKVLLCLPLSQQFVNSLAHD